MDLNRQRAAECPIPRHLWHCVFWCWHLVDLWVSTGTGSPPVFLSLLTLSPLPHLTFTPSLSNSPKSDTCKECDTFKVQTDAEQDKATVTQLKGEWELHLCKAECAYQQLKEDTALSKCDPNVMLVTFDLQQSLPTPVLTTNVVFYKRQLWTYNLGVHDCGSTKGYMYVWHEGTASRGPNEIGSCILKHIQLTNPTATHLTTFSDSCGGQNRNVYLLAQNPFTVTDMSQD